MGHSSYGVLAALFCAAIFNNLDPGLAIVLSIKPDAGTSDSLISYNTTDAQSYRTKVTSLETFLHDYRLSGTNQHRAHIVYNCDYDVPPPSWAVCHIDVNNWEPCTAQNNFGYHRYTPCVFLKLDTPAGWKPAFYNDTNSLPDAMPSDLKDHIRHLANTNPRDLNTVWVSCQGENPADVEFIGPISFIPRRGFPESYFFNNNIDGYLSPLVALYIRRPSTGVLINIECKAWARNIENNNTSTQGIGKFALLID